MTLKDDISRGRYHIMRLRARDISTKPSDCPWACRVMSS
jgi:hypothetical protein